MGASLMAQPATLLTRLTNLATLQIRRSGHFQEVTRFFNLLSSGAPLLHPGARLLQWSAFRAGWCSRMLPAVAAPCTRPGTALDPDVHVFYSQEPACLAAMPLLRGSTGYPLPAEFAAVEMANAEEEIAAAVAAASVAAANEGGASCGHQTLMPLSSLHTAARVKAETGLQDACNLMASASMHSCCLCWQHRGRAVDHWLSKL